MISSLLSLNLGVYSNLKEKTSKKVTKVSKNTTKTMEFILHFDPEKQKVTWSTGKTTQGLKDRESKKRIYKSYLLYLCCTFAPWVGEKHIFRFLCMSGTPFERIINNVDLTVVWTLCGSWRLTNVTIRMRFIAKVGF